MANYTLRFTDETNKPPIIIQPLKINGLKNAAQTALYVNTETGTIADIASTSLVFVGQNLTAYGEAVQTNLIRLLENFSNEHPPITPIEGQLWHKNKSSVTVPTGYPSQTGMYVYANNGSGLSWNRILVSTAGQIGVDGAELVNLSDPTLPQSAVTVSYAEANFFNIQSPTNTYSGSFTVSTGGMITLVDSPTNPTDAVNKDYVDGAITTINNALASETDTRQLADHLLQDQINNVAAGSQAAVVKTAGVTNVISSNNILDPTSSLTVQPGGGVLQFGLRRLQQVGDAVTGTDAMNLTSTTDLIQDYINNLPDTSDGVVYASTFDEITGDLTLSRTKQLPSVITQGRLVPYQITNPQPYSVAPGQTTTPNMLAAIDETLAATIPYTTTRELNWVAVPGVDLPGPGGYYVMDIGAEFISGLLDHTIEMYTYLDTEVCLITRVNIGTPARSTLRLRGASTRSNTSPIGYTPQTLSVLITYLDQNTTIPASLSIPIVVDSTTTMNDICDAINTATSGLALTTLLVLTVDGWIMHIISQAAIDSATQYDYVLASISSTDLSSPIQWDTIEMRSVVYGPLMDCGVPGQIVRTIRTPTTSSEALLVKQKNTRLPIIYPVPV